MTNGNNFAVAKQVSKVEFEPIDFGDMTQFNNETFRKIGITTRVAATLLAGSRGEMLKTARSFGSDGWFEFLSELDDVRKDVAGLQELLSMAFARGVVVTGLMAAEETTHV